MATPINFIGGVAVAILGTGAALGAGALVPVYYSREPLQRQWPTVSSFSLWHRIGRLCTVHDIAFHL